MKQPLWITEAEVVAHLDMARAIAALERGLVAEAAGEAANMAKTHAAWGDGDTLHAIGAVFSSRGVVGTKTWAHTAGGATPLLMLYDAHDGSLLAILEAFALGQFRTSAMSAVATRWLAAPDAGELAIIGTGKQSLPQVAAVAAVRPLRRVRVFSPTAAHREAFAARVQATLGIEAIASPTVHAASAGAAIVTLATRATAPFLFNADVEPGTHVNAIGAIVPSRVEFDPTLLARAAVVAADSPETVRRLSREFRDFYDGGGGAWSGVAAVSTIVAQRRTRPPGADLTIFKAMGMGISDLALGIDVLDAARAAGFGRPLPAPARASIDYTKRPQPHEVLT